MKKYTVKVKEVYTYDGVPAKSSEEAIEKVRNFEWQLHDEQDRPLEFTATKEGGDKE